MGSLDINTPVLNSAGTDLEDGWKKFVNFLGLQVTSTIDSTTQKVSAFNCTSTRTKSLPFSSTRNHDRFGLTAGQYTVHNGALGVDGVLMALDCDTSAPSSGYPASVVQPWTLFDILNGFMIDTPADGLAFNVLKAIGNLAQSSDPRDKVVQVDPSEAASGIWFLPSGIFREVTIGLTFKLVAGGVVSAISTALTTEFPMLTSLVDASAVSIGVKMRVLGRPSDSDSTQYDMLQFWSLIVKTRIGRYWFWIEHGWNGVSCTFTEASPNTSTDADGALAGLSELGAGNTLSVASVKPDLPNVFANFDLWTATVGKDDEGVYFNVVLLVHWVTNGQPFLVSLEYNSRYETFTGQLLFSTSFPDSSLKTLPYYDPRHDMPSTASGDNMSLYSGLLPELNLRTLFSGVKSGPDNLPTNVSRAAFGFSNATKQLQFSALLTNSSGRPPSTQPPVPAPFQWTGIMFDCTLASGASSFDIASSCVLNPRTDEYEAANVLLGLSYKNSTWSLTGAVSNFQLGALVEYFPPDVADILVDVLGKITIQSLKMSYTFTKTTPASASSFLFSGILLLGDLELQLMYQYASSSVAPADKTAAQIANPGDPKAKGAPDGDPTWFFEADLGADSPGATVGTIAASIVGDVANVIPDFVASIPINPAAGSQSLVSLQVFSAGDKTSPKVVFTLKIEIGIFKFTVLQIAGKAFKAKRIFRLTASKIPVIDTIPLVKELPQPFDQLIYMWVTDSSGLGWTSDDVSDVNGKLDAGSVLLVKAASKDMTKPVIPTGHHFMVIDGGQVILDHTFGSPDAKPKEQPASPSTSPPSPTTTQPPQSPFALPTPTPPAPPKEEEETAGPTKGALSKKTKYLSISNVGLQYKDGMLWIFVDATLALGPIQLSLIGFGLGLPIGKEIAKKKFNLNSIGDLLEHIEPVIHGMSVYFSQPPLTLAGVFEHEVTPTTDTYRGGISVGFVPYMFVAVGEYSNTTDANGHSYKAVFVFAKLDGPLITLEFATITGVRLGFGYNSAVRSPAIEELANFPFINDGSQTGAGNNPLAILKNMTGPGENNALPWVSPKENSYWFAMGMTITAFDLLMVTAVAMLAFKDSGIIASIYADGIATMPPGVTETSEMILRVEIGMVAEINFVEDYFRVEASLAPTSFLLVPQCHLYGGFALCYWFGSSPHAGDWVFSVGGYHRSYNPPAWYPNPKRLGVNFECGGGLNVTAEAYFAITPKAVMGGAMLHVSLNAGPVSAYLDASFDALINFHPLHYMVDMRIAVGCDCDINILFIHIHIHIQIGADLHIEGPEFGGVAHVDFYIFGFDVRFGADNSIPDPINLATFYDVIHKAGPDGVPPTTDATPNTMKHLKFCLEDGAFPMPAHDNKPVDPSKPADPIKPADPNSPATTSVDAVPNAGTGSLWHVKGGTFQFRIACDFALSAAHVKLDGTKDGAVEEVSGTLQPVYAKPMWVTKPIQSVLSITITSDETHEFQSGFKASFVLKPVPCAMWESYNALHDPMHSTDPAQMRANLFSPDNPAVTLAMGVSLHSPKPVLAKSTIPAFDASAAAIAPVLDTANNDAPIWRIATEEAMQKDYTATTPDSTETSKPNSARWDDMRNTWTNSFDANLVGDGLGDGTGMLGLCAHVLGWNVVDPGRAADLDHLNPAARRPWELVGAVPTNLVAGVLTTDSSTTPATTSRTGGLEEFYLALPQVSAAVT